MNIEITEIGGACPVQAEGTIDGNPFYFRARWDDWEFVVSQPGTDPVQVLIDGNGFYREGEHPNAGRMSVEEARDIIEQCAAEYSQSVAVGGSE